MGELINLNQIRAIRGERPVIHPKNPDGKLARYLAVPKTIQDRFDEGPPLNLSKPLEEMTAEEKVEHFIVIDTAARMAGLDYVEDWPHWTKEQVEAAAQELNAYFDELGEEQQAAVRQRISEIEEYEAKLLGIS